MPSFKMPIGAKLFREPIPRRSFAEASSFERLFAEWLTTDVVRDYYPRDAFENAQFSKLIITASSWTGYVIFFESVGCDKPTLHIGVLDGPEGKETEPGLVLIRHEVEGDLYLHPHWYVHGWRVFSFKRDGKDYVLRYSKSKHRYFEKPAPWI